MAIDDIEFQNDPQTLRLAPWLDMPALREQFNKALLVAIEPGGRLSYSYPLFRDDVREFCTGERKRCPKAGDIHSILWGTVSLLFPTSHTDRAFDRAINLIYTHVVDRIQWTRKHRGQNPNVTSTDTTITITSV